MKSILTFVALTTFSSASIAATIPAATPYWLQDIKHQGIATFNPDKTYKVFRNVKDYGAVGDGKHDDTAAINLAISSGNRCAPGSCNSTTTTPAIVYIPPGIYNLTGSIIDYYYTQIIGNPNSMPVLKADKSFNTDTNFGLIDGDRYGSNGQLEFGSTNTFYRQVRNIIFDTTSMPALAPATGIHWPTAQATSIQNCIFKLSDAHGSLHRGIFIESGSGGLINDLTFYGGASGGIFGNQQFTMRNLNIYNAQASGIQQLWDWGWTYKNINFYNCSVGLDMTATNSTNVQQVGSVTLLDSSCTNTKICVATNYHTSASPPTTGSLILENVVLKNTPIAVTGTGQTTLLAGTAGQTTIAGWGQGHKYTPNGPVTFQGAITPFPRPASLVSGGKFYERAKPQYEKIPVSGFLSARSSGCKGDGKMDDSACLTNLFANAVKQNKIAFVDAGDYFVASTVKIPPGAKVVGEAYSVILGGGAKFLDAKNPYPVVQVGTAGQTGAVEWSDMIVSTQGGTAGAVLIEWNLASTSSAPSGMWDVHTRIGGFAGSNLQVKQCLKTPNHKNHIPAACVAAFMSMHITKSATGLYLENVWLWTADHDIEDPNVTQISVYTGRGLFSESTKGNIWLVGTAVEHHLLYQYQFASTTNLFAGQIQTETPYYQPNPPATTANPYPLFPSLSDPDFVAYCAGRTGTCGDAWGLRVVKSTNLLFYGAGLYSFFNNYSTTCSDYGNGETCQTQIFGIDSGGPKGTDVGTSQVYMYNLNTIGSVSMIDRNDKSLASFKSNVNTFADTIALFRTS